MINHNKLDEILLRVRQEVFNAHAMYGNLNSAHEGYAVLKEEVEEAWDEIKRKNVPLAKEEMVQVAAMAISFMLDIDVKDEDSDFETDGSSG